MHRGTRRRKMARVKGYEKNNGLWHPVRPIVPPSRQQQKRQRRGERRRGRRMSSMSTVGGVSGFVNRFRRSHGIGYSHKIRLLSPALARPIVFRHPRDRPIVSPFVSPALPSFFSLSSLSTANHFFFPCSSRPGLFTLVVNQDLCVPPVETFAPRD